MILRITFNGSCDERNMNTVPDRHSSFLQANTLTEIELRTLHLYNYYTQPGAVPRGGGGGGGGNFPYDFRLVVYCLSAQRSIMYVDDDTIPTPL